MDHHLERLKREVAAAIAGVAPEQWDWHPPGKWCAAEVLEHLYLTYTGTWKGFQRMAEAGHPLVSASSWKQIVGKQVVLRFSYMPPGREAPSSARPRGVPPEKVRAEVLSKIDEMDAMISECEEKHGPGKLLDHPILGALTGAEWRKFHLVHGLHHLRQIRQLRESAGAGK